MQDYRTAFCINCGANEDVHDIMESVGPMAQQFVRFVIVDSHRPIHHSLNDGEDHSCVLLHDPDCGDAPLKSIPAATWLEPGTGKAVPSCVVNNHMVPNLFTASLKCHAPLVATASFCRKFPAETKIG